MENMNREISKEKEEKLNKLFADNEDNKEYETEGYGKGYYEGYHDCLVDVMKALNIATDEEYYD